MAPKKVGPNMKVVRVKEGAPQRATYVFECADGSIALVQEGETVRKTYIRRDGQTLTVNDVWEAMKMDRQKITKDLDNNLDLLVLTTEDDRENALLGSVVLSERDTVLVLRDATRKKKTAKSSKAASSSAAVEGNQTLENADAKKDNPTKITRTGSTVVLEFRTQAEAENGLKNLVDFYDMEDQMNATILAQITKLKAMLVKKGPAAAATTEDDDDDTDEESGEEEDLEKESDEEEELEEEADESEM
jgi:hypothetical protein